MKLVSFRSPGVAMTLTCSFPPEKIIARFAGTLRLVSHTANSLSSQTGRFRLVGTPATPISLPRLPSTAGSRSKPSRTPARIPLRRSPTRIKRSMEKTSLPRLRFSPRCQISRFPRLQNGSSDPAARPLALVVELFLSTCSRRAAGRRRSRSPRLK